MVVIGVPGYRCAGIPVYSVSVYMCTSAPGGCGGGDGEQEEHKIQFAHRMYLSCGGGKQEMTAAMNDGSNQSLAQLNIQDDYA